MCRPLMRWLKSTSRICPGEERRMYSGAFVALATGAEPEPPAEEELIGMVAQAAVRRVRARTLAVRLIIVKSFRLLRSGSAKPPRAGTPLGEELASQLARRRGGVPARFLLPRVRLL